MFSVGLSGTVCVLGIYSFKTRAKKNFFSVIGKDTGICDDIYAELNKYILRWTEKIFFHIKNFYSRYIEKIISYISALFHFHAIKSVNHAHGIFSRLKDFLERKQYHRRQNSSTSRFLSDIAAHKMTSKKQRKIMNTEDTDMTA